VVDVDTVLKYQQSEAAGTGIVLTAAGEILTNNHVVEGATSISVTVVATGKSYVATVVGTDASHDVAVLQLKGASGLTPAHLGTSGHVAVGDAVTAVGNAGGRGGTPTVATGQVTALGQSITATDDLGGHVEQLTNLIQVDAPLQPGESGGPLYDAKGEVIGMDTAGSAIRRSRTRSTEGFAIPIDDALAVAKRIETGQSGGGVVIGSPGFLGVGVQDATTRSGAEVTQIVSGSPAAAIGLQVGDVLVGVDGKTITSADTVAGALQAHHAGDAVKVAWVDQSGGQHSATATLIEGPAR
jgi:S1-C subfamily serine protease